MFHYFLGKIKLWCQILQGEGIFSVPYEGYSKNVSCALNWISAFLLLIADIEI
jgi:hypothetical protein